MKVIPGTYLMKVILGTYLMKVILGTYLMKVILGTYLMKVILGTYLMKQNNTQKTKDRTKRVPLNFSKIYLINHVSVEALTTGRMIPSGTNSPPKEVSTQ
jgi:hypothetical protein